MADLINGLGGPAGFGSQVSIGRNDDQVTPAIDLTSVFPNGLNYFGQVFTSLFVSNNGRLTFVSPDGSFTPAAISGATGNPQINVFFADVDTGLSGPPPAPTPGGTSTGSDLVYVARDPVGGRFVVTWDDVGYFSQNVDKLNAFQIVLTNTAATGAPGDFDIDFRYESINWTTGDANSGVDGLGGTVARAGYSAGTGRAGEFFELPASGDQQAVLDLDINPGNTGEPGLWSFAVRGGVVTAPDPVAADDSFATIAGLSLSLPLQALLANDPAFGGGGLQVTALGGAQHGATALSGDTFLFTPEPGFVGDAGFTYTTLDPSGVMFVGQVEVTVLQPWGGGLGFDVFA